MDSQEIAVEEELIPIHTAPPRRRKLLTTADSTKHAPLTQRAHTSIWYYALYHSSVDNYALFTLAQDENSARAKFKAMASKRKIGSDSFFETIVIFEARTGSDHSVIIGTSLLDGE